MLDPHLRALGKEGAGERLAIAGWRLPVLTTPPPVLADTGAAAPPSGLLGAQTTRHRGEELPRVVVVALVEKTLPISGAADRLLCAGRIPYGG